jgi:hypothetical protein
MTLAFLKKGIRRLYEGATPNGVRFRYALLAFDIVTVLFIIATSFLPSHKIVEALDVLFGLVILADFSARLLISPHRLRDLPASQRGPTWLRSFRSWPPLRDRPAAFSASCERCDCCATIRCWCGCASIARSFGAMRKFSLLSPTSRCSSS